MTYNKDEKLSLKKPPKNIDEFLTGSSEKSHDKPWGFVLKFDKKEEEDIKSSFEDSKYKAMYEFLKNAILTNKDFIKRK